MSRKLFYIAIVYFIFFFILVLVDSFIAPTQFGYALRPVIQITNWGGSVEKIHFPYLDTKYNLNHEDPYEFVETDAGYDLILHFKSKPDSSVE